MLHSRKKDGKYLPYRCLLTKIFKLYKLKLEKRTPRRDKSVYNHSSFKDEAHKNRVRMKMRKSCTEREKQATTLSKKTSKAKVKRSLEEKDNVASKGGSSKIQKNAS